MTGTRERLDAELAPVRAALYRIARADADQCLAQADREVAQQLTAADTEAGDLLEQARDRSAADAAALLAVEQSRAMREARTVELRARRAAYDALVSASAAAVRAQVANDPEVVAAVTERAFLALGPGATITPDPDAGVVARKGDRCVALPLPALVERAVADLLISRESP